MAAVVIGALRVDLGLSTASFKKDASAAAREAEVLGKRVQNAGMGMVAAGAGISAAISLPFVALMKEAIPAAQQSNEALGQVKAALASMGPLAGKTAADLQGLAAGLQATSTIDDDDILRDLTANMLTFGNVAGTEFDRAQQAALDMSVRMKTDLKGAAMMVGKALNDPVAGLAKLSKAGIQFTEEQKAQVKAMQASGDMAGAQSIMLAELEKQFGGSAQAQRDATPGADATDAWREFNETLGQIALDILPPLTTALTSVLDSFNSLSPSTQSFLVIAVGLVAALGPLLIVVGAIVTGAGTLIGLFGTLAGAMGITGASGAAAGAGLGAAGAGATAAGAGASAASVGVRALMLSLGPIALLIGAVVAAWYYWDDIVAIVGRVGEAVSGWYNANVKPTVDGALASLGSLVDWFKATFEPYITGVVGVVGGLLKGDFAGAFAALKTMAIAHLENLLSAFGGMPSKAVEAMSMLYSGAKTWIQDKLGNVFGWLKEKISAVGDWFYQLYDRVVGHSYVPDMVDKIGLEMKRLDSDMVGQAQKATKKTAATFADMAKEIAPLMDELFPDQARVNAIDKKLELLQKARNAGEKKGGISEATYQAAKEKLRVDRLGDKAGPGSVTDQDKDLDKPFFTNLREMVKIPKEMDKVLFKPLGEMAKQTAMDFVDMADGIVDTVRGMVDAFKGGDIVGGIKGILSLVGQVADLVAGIQGKPNGFQGVGKTPDYGGPRALGGAVVPGKRYRIGERGPEYVSFGARGQITPDNDRGGRGMVVNFNGVMTSDEFWSKIEDLDGQAAQKGAMSGANMVYERQAKVARSRLGGR